MTNWFTAYVTDKAGKEIRLLERICAETYAEAKRKLEAAMHDPTMPHRVEPYVVGGAFPLKERLPSSREGSVGDLVINYGLDDILDHGSDYNREIDIREWGY